MAERARLFLLFVLVLHAAAHAQEVGSRVCAQCHSGIAQRYAATPMAQSSGRLSAIHLPSVAAPLNEPSWQAAIRLKRTEEGDFTLSIERQTPPLSVSRELKYFIGSGRIGRSFLFEQDNGFLYQAPVSYYADGDTYRASPGFQRKSNVDLTRAVQPSCLMCHASRLQPIPGTQNRFDAVQPFLEAGVSCERCHGPGQRHVSAMKTPANAGRPANLAIINPAKLPASQRDSVCAQCHLTGVARIARAATKGKSSYTPGDDLARTIAVFVWDGVKDTGLTVTSHFEALDRSRCKQASGERLWCGSCHEPHGNPIDLRARCITCHAASKSCVLDAPTRSARNNDQCQECHMPKAEVQDAEHAVYTDHSIPRRPTAPARTAPSASRKQLVPFWPSAPEDARDLAMAYATTALTEPSVRGRAFELLRAAGAKDPTDLAIVTQLAQFYDRMGQPQQALPLYERVVAKDPTNVAALVNLGTLYAQANRLMEAIALWQRALKANPAQTQVRMNLAVAQVRLGNREAGIADLKLALALDPDNEAVARLLLELR